MLLYSSDNVHHAHMCDVSPEKQNLMLCFGSSLSSPSGTLLEQQALTDQNNRAGKEQSQSVQHWHWSAWMDTGTAGNSSTGLWPRCWYSKTDVTLNPSLREEDVYDSQKSEE